MTHIWSMMEFNVHVAEHILEVKEKVNDYASYTLFLILDFLDSHFLQNLKGSQFSPQSQRFSSEPCPITLHQ